MQFLQGTLLICFLSIFHVSIARPAIVRDDGDSPGPDAVAANSAASTVDSAVPPAASLANVGGLGAGYVLSPEQKSILEG